MIGQLPPRVLVTGLGRSGQAAARLVADLGSEVWATDLRSADELGTQLDSLPRGVRTFLGGHPEACLDGVGLVVTSPGVPPTAAPIVAAEAFGVPVVAEVELAWSLRPEATLVAVTGSNGKSTVTELVNAMLESAGRATVAGGNLGTPASELVMENGWDTWVLEISSFQAERLMALRPSVGIFLNISQDHLERHPNMPAYLAAKRRLFSHQTGEDCAVLNADEPGVAATPTPARRRLFSLSRNSDGCLVGHHLYVNDEYLLPSTQLALSGRHNVANALAAALAAMDLGVNPEAVASVLRSFAGLPHRHRTVQTRNGVHFVDDSKATNVGATLAALSGYADGSVHLILGGLAKSQDFSVLADEVRRACAQVYLIGADAETIANALPRVSFVRSVTLDVAVQQAAEAARSGDTVLLAPACASFDQFSSYAARGDAFTRLVMALGGPNAA
jgi:UDP-N-acetylmuramoylalanine--D-glutamate ligase